MRLAYLAFIAFLAGLTFLVLTIADQERLAQAGVESISRYKIALPSPRQEDRGLRLASTSRPSLRSER